MPIEVGGDGAKLGTRKGGWEKKVTGSSREVGHGGEKSPAPESLKKTKYRTRVIRIGRKRTG